MNPEFDSDGYPTENTLEFIKNWKIHKRCDCRDLLAFVEEAWSWKNYFNSDPERDGEKELFKISTGGWSGNEDLIVALKENRVFWAICWMSSKRGGHYEFLV